MLVFMCVMGFFILTSMLAFRTLRPSTTQPSAGFSLSAFLRASIISFGAGIPLFVLFLLICLYIPGSNVDFWGPPQPPTNSFYIISTIIGICFLYADYRVGRKYYRSIQSRTNRK